MTLPLWNNIINTVNQSIWQKQLSGSRMKEDLPSRLSIWLTAYWAKTIQTSAPSLVESSITSRHLIRTGGLTGITIGLITSKRFSTLESMLNSTRIPDLAELLTMTGDFDLVKASPKDFSCGVGYHASVARKMRLKGRWGQNLLGEALEQVRSDMRWGYRIVNRGYAYDFFRLWEETCNYERYRRLQKSSRLHVKMPDHLRTRREIKKDLKSMKRAWLNPGGLSDSGSDDEGFEDDDEDLHEG